MTRGSIAPCGVNSRGQAAEGRKATVSDCVHAAMQDVQAPRRDPAVDRARAQPERQQLQPHDHPVLALSQRRDRSIEPTR
jgi:hypothetical protein